MKKIILLALTALIMVGCDYPPISYATNDGTIVVVIDSCEYIRQHTYLNDIHTHKGNCKFCKERRQKELKELVIKLKEK